MTAFGGIKKTSGYVNQRNEPTEKTTGSWDDTFAGVLEKIKTGKLALMGPRLRHD
jgi:hypothetical protein